MMIMEFFKTMYTVVTEHSTCVSHLLGFSWFFSSLQASIPLGEPYNRSKVSDYGQLPVRVPKAAVACC